MAGATTQADRQAQVLAAGYNGPLTDAAINQAYANAATPSDLADSGISDTPQSSNSSSGPTNPNNPASNIEMFNQQAEALKNQAAQNAAQIAYEYAHMNTIEVPGLQLQKDQLAFQQAQDAGLEAYRQADLNLRTLAQNQSNAIASGQLDLAKLTQQQQNQLAVANLGLNTLQLVASLQADPFRQQQVINGLSAAGYSNAINMVLGAQGAGQHGLLGSAADSNSLAQMVSRIVSTTPTGTQDLFPNATPPGTTPPATGATPNAATSADASQLPTAQQIQAGASATPAQLGFTDPNAALPKVSTIAAGIPTQSLPSTAGNPNLPQTAAAPATATPAATPAPAAAAPAAAPASTAPLFNPPSGADGAQSGANNPAPTSNPNNAMTPDNVQAQAAIGALPSSPNQIVARNFLQLDPTSQQYVLSGESAKTGLSMDDVKAQIAQTLPGFSAPRGTIGTG